MINSVEFSEPYVIDSDEEILVSVENASEIHYFIVDSKGEIILNGIKEEENDEASIRLDKSSDIIQGVHTIKIFAASENVLKPYEYSKSFIIVSNEKEIPKTEMMTEIRESEANNWYVLLIIPIFSIIAILVIRRSRLSANNK